MQKEKNTFTNLKNKQKNFLPFFKKPRHPKAQILF